jgi:hypothetical protein
VLVEDFLHQMALRRSVWQIPAREFSAVVLFETAIAIFHCIQPESAQSCHMVYGPTRTFPF